MIKNIWGCIIISDRAIDKNGKIVFAYNNGLDYNATYICPNSKCNAEMILKGVKSEKVKPHFSAKKNSKHIENCIYRNTHSDNVKYALDNVNIDNIFKGVFEEIKANDTKKENRNNANNVKKENIEDKVEKGRITNIKHLYTATHNLDYKREINGIKIDDFLITKKNYQEHWGDLTNPFKSTGLKLVELSYCKTYPDLKNDEYTIFCVLPYDKNCEYKPKIKLKFKGNYEVYSKIIKELDAYKKSNDPATIVVLGDFMNLTCEITTDKQISFIKHPTY